MTRCPHCGKNINKYRNPFPTVDIIIYDAERGLVLIRRNNPPLGWALPGGFIDYGEAAEDAARREALEETGLKVRLQGLVGVYSRPDRDPRHHTISTVYWATAENVVALAAGDDAGEAAFFPLASLPQLAFDHQQIIADFMQNILLLSG
ncbi:NUDIX hydrolase [Desulfovibrio sp. OttesenSCG-928-C14]|nr:NUDIX hydrolase [Desulfovibrio sp. OttesenSCG-928-C14]